jgi:hypothetical protein
MTGGTCESCGCEYVHCYVCNSTHHVYEYEDKFGSYDPDKCPEQESEDGC